MALWTNLVGHGYELLLKVEKLQDVNIQQVDPELLSAHRHPAQEPLPLCSFLGALALYNITDRLYRGL